MDKKTKMRSNTTGHTHTHTWKTREEKETNRENKRRKHGCIKDTHTHTHFVTFHQPNFMLCLMKLHGDHMHCGYSHVLDRKPGETHPQSSKFLQKSEIRCSFWLVTVTL